MTDLHVVPDPPPPPARARLLEYGAAWREAKEIAEAHRVRVRRAVLEAIDGGMTAPEAALLTGVSRVTINSWRRWRRRGELA